jgi:hypothetical protein
MNNNFKPLIITLLAFVLNTSYGQVGISETPGFTPHGSAVLDISSFTKGLLIPRMKTSDRMAIAMPEKSLLVYDTQLASFMYWDGTDWLALGGSAGVGSAWYLTGNNAIDPALNFIGNVDGAALNFRTNNVQQMQIIKAGNIGIGADAEDFSRLFVNGKSVRNGISTVIAAPFGLGAANEYETFGVKSINSSENFGHKYGGYFESNGYNVMNDGNNIGISAKASKSGYTNIGLYASAESNTTNNLAAHFDVGHVKISNHLAIGKSPSLTNQFEILKVPSKNAGFIDMEYISKSNNIYFGRNFNGLDFIGLEINTTNTPTKRALEVHGNATFYDKVGINTITVPTAYSLAVNGFIIAEELRIQNHTAWPDYVFDQKYQLKPLAEVADFIKINKHLPEVPSAKVVETEGIVLGEMQRTLLKKIEELTLYIIDQQKQIDILKTKVETLNHK